MHELIEKTLKEASSFFQNFLIHEYSEKTSLHLVDPRLKLIGTFLLIILAISTFLVEKIIVLIASSLILVSFSKISLRKFISRTWLFPVFSFIIMIPLIIANLNNVTYSIIFALRVFTAISLIQLFIMTTKFNEIVFALQYFRVPKALTQMVWITYRYIILMFSEILRILLAREARRIKESSHIESIKKAGNSLGLFFIRTYERAERINLAIMARGEITFSKKTFLRFDAESNLKLESEVVDGGADEEADGVSKLKSPYKSERSKELEFTLKKLDKIYLIYIVVTILIWVMV